tara:strand:+ start:2314 stop:2820 length:507 start_codon:yes stop_codon:yes gene_type:complete
VNKWLFLILELIAIASAFLGMIIVLMMMYVIVKEITRIKIQKNKKRRTRNMSNQAKEGVTFNDVFMFFIAVPLVLLWVGFAGAVIYVGLGNSQVLESIESYTTLIAILGGPALLIIKDALDVWKQEQAEKTAFYKTKAQSVIDFNASVLQQAQDIESNEQIQDHKERK